MSCSCSRWTALTTGRSTVLRCHCGRTCDVVGSGVCASHLFACQTESCWSAGCLQLCMDGLYGSSNLQPRIVPYLVTCANPAESSCKQGHAACVKACMYWACRRQAREEGRRAGHWQEGRVGHLQAGPHDHGAPVRPGAPLRQGQSVSLACNCLKVLTLIIHSCHLLQAIWSGMGKCVWLSMPEKKS